MTPKNYKESLSELIRQYAPKPLTGAEVGVANGRLSEYLLYTFPELWLYMVDHWRPSPETYYAATGDPNASRPESWYQAAKNRAIDRTEKYAGRRVVCEMGSLDAAARFEHELSFVYLDADHSVQGLTADLMVWRRALSPGGLLCGNACSPPESRIAQGVAYTLTKFQQKTGIEIHYAPHYTWWCLV